MIILFLALLRIHVGFNADLDPAYQVNSDRFTSGPRTIRIQGFGDKKSKKYTNEKNCYFIDQ
jgi:hypothetical protein